MKGISHIAICVRDMEKSLRFYRDLLGMKVIYDRMERIGRGAGGGPALYDRPEQEKRRAVHLHYGEGAAAGSIVLSQAPAPASGNAIKLDQIGISHFAWLVDDVRAVADKLKSAGVKFLVPPVESAAAGLGQDASTKYVTCLFEDPDGVILQLDQFVRPS